MDKLQALVVNGQRYALPTSPVIAMMDSLDEYGNAYICTSHTALQLRNTILSGTPVMAIMRNQGPDSVALLLGFAEGTHRVVFGDFLGDSGYQHIFGQPEFYQDGDPDIAEAGNEIWLNY